MKKYETPDFVKIDFFTEAVLENSIIEPDDVNDPVEMGPPINIFG